MNDHSFLTITVIYSSDIGAGRIELFAYSYVSINCMPHSPPPGADQGIRLADLQPQVNDLAAYL